MPVGAASNDHMAGSVASSNVGAKAYAVPSLTAWSAMSASTGKGLTVRCQVTWLLPATLLAWTVIVYGLPVVVGASHETAPLWLSMAMPAGATVSDQWHAPASGWTCGVIL